MIGAFRLPWILQRSLEAASRNWLYPVNGPAVDFARPAGEQALVSPHSVSWRIFKNPVALFVGGIAAVLLELAEPAVRTGVWEHSNFNSNPLGRLRRTGLAAMITIYGPRSVAEAMISRVVRMHSRVTGITPGGIRYAANDSDLLSWVHVTAAYGFVSAYSRYVEVISASQLDEYYRESVVASRLYGATHAPQSNIEARTLFDSMESRLEPSPIIFRFLQIMRETAALPTPIRWLQPSLVRAAVELVPASIRDRLGLDPRYDPSPRDRLLANFAGAIANRILLHESPAVQSCIRLGLPASHLYG
jgi:uncharacterized protein (DUF2236 family)